VPACPVRRNWEEDRLTLYLDIIWLLNFCIDLLLLMLTALILKRETNKWRLIAGAFLGSVFIVFLFTPLSGMMYDPLGKFLYSVIIVLTVFGFRRFYHFVQVLFMFYCVTFMIGGGMFALHYFMKTDNVLLNEMTSNVTPFGDPVSWGFVLIGFPVFWFFSKQRIKQVEAKKIRYDRIASVDIQVEGLCLNGKGLIDSGNQLHDPLTKTPVMIIELRAFSGDLPRELFERAQQPDVFQDDGADLPSEWENRIRLIPYRGVGNQNDFLLAFKPDSVRIELKNEVYKCKKVFVGLNTGNLSGESEFNCIVHPKMLAGDPSKQSAS
jgi:stage II sporulation protein GA (sporulation sigma-E factor processing peptidase)